MTKIEKEKIVDFIDALMESDYNRANKNLGVVVTEKIKAKLEKAKHVKPFGKKDEDDNEDTKGKNKSSKSEKPKKGKLPPWLEKKKGKK